MAGLAGYVWGLWLNEPVQGWKGTYGIVVACGLSLVAYFFARIALRSRFLS